MKTEMPFYGVKAGARRKLVKQLAKDFVPADRAQYETWVRALWSLPHREEKYVAIGLARAWKQWVSVESVELYEQLIRQGAWWDFVDEIAAHLVGTCLADDPDAVWPIMDRWIDDPGLWIRRSALLCQLRHKQRTDSKRLFDYCRRRMSEKEFFIRKAIGWALRQYSYTDGEAVWEFLQENREELSGLSSREGVRVLQRSRPV